MKNLTVKNVILVILGSLFLGLGIGMYVKVGIGVDAFSAFQAGFANIFGCKLGTITALSNLLLLIIAFFINKKYIGPATIIFILIAKWPVDIGQTYMISTDSFGINLLLGIVSLLTITLGCELMILSDLGANAYDAVTLGIKSRLKKDVKYVYIRYAFDGLILLIAFIIKGPIGFGTILAWATMGYMIKAWEKILAKLLKMDIKGI